MTVRQLSQTHAEKDISANLLYSSYNGEELLSDCKS